jgi:hypothetical protein
MRKRYPKKVNKEKIAQPSKKDESESKNKHFVLDVHDSGTVNKSNFGK